LYDDVRIYSLVVSDKQSGVHLAVINI